ncbi:MAG: hypothetical protein EXR84_04550 [Gammaproteobacteria bacterium]|nr:hypothetical protein [Gammaproteobacteria bacterium]
MRRNIRRSIDAGLTLAGILVIFGSVFFANTIGVQALFLLVLFGVLIMEIGVWGLSSRLLPSERKFSRLREEGDNMITLIRELNASAIAKDRGEEDAKRFQQTLASMHDSVVRMAELAAHQDDDSKA